MGKCYAVGDAYPIVPAYCGVLVAGRSYAHATREEAEAEAQKMLHVYGDFAEKYMAVPVIKGVKSANERFAGALDTYTIEGLMQDGKALQCGTSHFLGQNFAKAFNVQFVDKNNKLDYVWATSWGVSTV